MLRALALCLTATLLLWPAHALAAGEQKLDPDAAALLSKGLDALKKSADDLLYKLKEPPAAPAIAKVKSILARGIARARTQPLTVRVEGVVTCVCPTHQPWLFVEDDTGGIFMMLRPGVAVPPAGRVITVQGKTASGPNAAYLVNTTIVAEGGTAPMPQPRPATPLQVQGQVPYGHWVESEGILRDAYTGRDGLVRIQIALANGAFESVLHTGGQEYMQRRMLESRVRVRGVCWNHATAHMHSPDAERDVTVVSRSEVSGFDRPPEDAAPLLDSPGDRMAVVRATFVLKDVVDRWRLIAEDGTPIHAVPAWPWDGSVSGVKPQPPEPGTAVLLEALFMKRYDVLTGAQAWMRPVGPGAPLPGPVATTPAGAGSTGLAGRLISVRGRIVKMEERRHQRMVPPYDQVPYLVAALEGEDDGAALNVIAPISFRDAIKALPDSRLVQVTGYQTGVSFDPERKPNIWMRTPADITSAGLTRTAFRNYAWGGAGGLGVLLLTGGGFLWALREKLKRQRSEAAIIGAHNATLEARVSDRTLELAAANERLTRASDEALSNLARERELGDLKSNFVSMVSHEFRTPLAVILSSTELLSNHLDRLSPERRAQQFASIRGSTLQMARLIEEVLLLGKVEAGRMSFNPAALNLRDFCGELVDEALSATARRCPVTFTCGADVPAAVSADAALLRHVFSNLVSNASKYSPEGKEVELSVSMEDDHLVFRVTDRGIGIPESDVPHLFQPFHRAKNVGQISGTGLGLMIARRCVELHGGDIFVHSIQGEGTTVTVVLPFVELPGDQLLRAARDRQPAVLPSTALEVQSGVEAILEGAP